ncbi:MAG TPA: DUF2911 domain-containing protein [Candidatus Acidoferrales bacterium]|jgi:hypothetical protein|nr:DUF2911 domain-containing protein [Candidatus Acidoferrales bacterium]
MLRIHRAVLFAAIFATLAATASAQRPRYTSPQADAAVTIAGKKIAVEYYAPSAHGRKVMGGLVPYGQVWCTGANWATKITTEADLEMGGLKVPKGSYSIWTVPDAREWTLIINSETGQFHLNYDQSRDFGRTKMALKTLPSLVETFKVQLSAAGGDKGTLALIWENTEASVPITVLH